MKKSIVLFLGMLIPTFFNITQAQCSHFAGQWNGSLQIQGISLRLIVNIECKSDTATATFDSPDQGAKDIPFGKVTINEASIIMAAPALRAEYRGQQTNDTLIEGTWTQGGMSLPLNLSSASKPFTVNRPQEPKLPLGYKTEEVQFASKADGVTLAATLTIPEGKGPFTAVVLVSGSGPQNRDEALLSHKPFLVLSDHLTRHGIAVLRYDDRGVEKSTGQFATATTLDFADDAEGAVNYLLTRTEINKQKIGIAGHSEGGLIAPVVASRNKKVAFVVLMAGPGQKSSDLMADQTRLIALASGETEAAVNESVAINQKLFTILKQQPNDSVALVEMKQAALDAIATVKTISDEEKKGQIDQLPTNLKRIITPWFRMFIAWDPAPWLEKVKCPVLAINGSADLQVPSNKNLPLIEAALKEGGNNQSTIIELKGLNHLFQHSATGSPSEYGLIEETFAPEAMEIVARWIKER